MDAAQLQQRLLDNADFDDPFNADKARRYKVAARQVLSGGIPEEVWHNGERIRFDREFLRAELIRCEQLIAANSSTLAAPQTVHQSLERFRD